MNIRLLAVIIALSSAAASAATLESSAVSASEGMNLPALPKFAPSAVAAPRTRRPRVATAVGSINQRDFDLTFDRMEWTVKGAINLRPCEVKIDHENATIKGGMNGAPVDLAFVFSPEKYTIEGGVNQSPVKYEIVWAAGTLDGYANLNRLHLDFNLEEGTAMGTLNQMPVELKLDAVTGKLTGAMNYMQLGATLTNMDLSDILQNFFLFVKRP